MTGGSARRHPGGAWLLLLLSTAVGVALVESVLLEVYSHLFTGRFPAITAFPSAQAGVAFFASAVALNAATTLVLWTLAAPIARRLGLGPIQGFAAALLLGAGVPLGFDAVRYPLRSYLGAPLDLELFLDLAGGHVRGLVAVAGEHMAPLGALLALVVAGSIALVWGLRRVDVRGRWLASQFAPPSTGALALGAVALVALSGALLAGLCGREGPICHGLQETTAGSALAHVVAVATDVDRDGYGLLVWPRDSAPLDSSIHPYATDLPANGVDENGIGGDHPAGHDWVEPTSDTPAAFARRPHFLLVFLESFREDLLDAEHDGRRVLPALAALAAEGARSRHAYANSPFTIRSRAQLFGGRLYPYAGQSTLVDDFLANGYRVAWFSGQDDSFGNSAALLGYERGDDFYDARQDLELRYTESASQASLGVSWKVLNSRVLPYLAKADAARPLFLYVNYYDTHYPYHHREVDDLLFVPAATRAEITPSQRERVWRTYLNTAANVDHALGELLSAWRAFAGEREWAVLVVADHAQEFFDHGHLGHGQSLRAEQSRVPLVVRGLGGEWPEPLGIADLRGLVQRNLASAGEPDAQTRFVPDPTRAVFQFLGGIGRPRILGLQRQDDAIFYRFATARLDHVAADGSDLAPAEPALFDALVWRWESIVRAEREAGRLP